MSKGYLWFSQNNADIDYSAISCRLAKSIKKFNNDNAVCVIVDEDSIFASEYVDKIIVLKKDDSKNHSTKFSNEYKAFALSPFTHTIKLEADMLFSANTDGWWDQLCQHDLVFSINCRNYLDEVIVDSTYRKLFLRNNLPNIYNGLTYFRRSQRAMQFFELCKDITQNWEYARDNLLINCHDSYPTTDVVYALAYRIMDPLQQQLIDYPWFKFLHSKPAINKIFHTVDQNNYLNPIVLSDRIYLGGKRLGRIWHYHDKKTKDLANERIF